MAAARRTQAHRTQAPEVTPRSPTREQRRWLLFVHQLPSTPSNLRVKTWRRMQQLGAVAVKQAVYVLPDSPQAREDFEWLKTEIEGSGGEASVFVGGSIDAWSDDALVEEFRRTRQEAYAALADEVEQVLRKLDAPRRQRPSVASKSRRALDLWRQRFASIEQVDFFGSAGRDRVVTLLAAFEERLSQGTRSATAADRSGQADPEIYRRRLWVTRPRPGVDRMSSAWLIRRFVDPEARFGFVADREATPQDAIPFDMFGVELTHRGEHCTFETLCAVFGIAEAAVSRIAAIVHDLDLKDGRFGTPEAPSVGLIIDGLQLAYADDEALLAQGMVLFEALYQAGDRAARPSRPRPVATKRAKGDRRNRRR